MTTAERIPTPEELRASFGRWLDDHHGELDRYRHESHLTLEAQYEALIPLQRTLFDAGWSRHGWPVECGGLGGNALLRAVFYDELSLAGFPFPESYQVIETLAPAIVRFAPALAARYLPRLLAGDEAWCQGFSEPNAGSDLASLRCRAVETTDGFVVNGQKVWTSLAQMAARCALLVRTGGPGPKGITMLFVDVAAPGVTVTPLRAATGRNEFCELFFDDVFVPADHVVGSVNGGWGVAMHLLQWERGMYAWQRQAMLHSRLADLVTAQKQPDADGALGDVYAGWFALRVKCRDTLRHLAAGTDLGPEISIDKVLLAAAETTVMDLARRLSEHRFELGDDPHDEQLRQEWFYSRAASIYGGAAEIQRSIIAERVLGLPREAPGGR
jgi:alkylation response protein AidB-like acyl-CoA dehydrogenase